MSRQLLAAVQLRCSATLILLCMRELRTVGAAAGTAARVLGRDVARRGLSAGLQAAPAELPKEVLVQTGIDPVTGSHPEALSNVGDIRMTEPTPPAAANGGVFCKGSSCQYRVPPPDPTYLPTPFPNKHYKVRDREFCRGLSCPPEQGFPEIGASGDKARFLDDCGRLFDYFGGGLDGDPGSRNLDDLKQSVIRWCEKRVPGDEAGNCPGYADVFVVANSDKAASTTIGGVGGVCKSTWKFLTGAYKAEMDLRLTKATLPSSASLLAVTMNHFGTGGVGPSSSRGREWKKVMKKRGYRYDRLQKDEVGFSGEVPSEGPRISLIGEKSETASAQSAECQARRAASFLQATGYGQAAEPFQHVKSRPIPPTVPPSHSVADVGSVRGSHQIARGLASVGRRHASLLESEVVPKTIPQLGQRQKRLPSDREDTVTRGTGEMQDANERMVEIQSKGGEKGSRNERPRRGLVPPGAGAVMPPEPQQELEGQDGGGAIADPSGDGNWRGGFGQEAGGTDDDSPTQMPTDEKDKMPLDALQEVATGIGDRDNTDATDGGVNADDPGSGGEWARQGGPTDASGRDLESTDSAADFSFLQRKREADPLDMSEGKSITDTWLDGKKLDPPPSYQIPKYNQNPPCRFGVNEVPQSQVLYMLVPGSSWPTPGAPTEITGDLLQFCSAQFKEIGGGYSQTPADYISMTGDWCKWQASMISWIDRKDELGHPDWTASTCDGMTYLLSYILRDILDSSKGISSGRLCKEVFLAMPALHRVKGIVWEAWNGQSGRKLDNGLLKISQPSGPDPELVRKAQEYAAAIFGKLRAQKEAFSELNDAKMDTSSFDTAPVPAAPAPAPAPALPNSADFDALLQVASAKSARLAKGHRPLRRWGS